MHTAEAPSLSIRGVSKTFGTHQALKGVDLEIAPGEFVGLLGPNGAGKSTLVKVLDGVHQATSGKILIDGVPVASLSGHPAVGFVHQDLGLVDDLSVVENLRLGQRALGGLGPFLNARAERKAAEAALAAVELDISVLRPVGSLSPAEKALVAVARVFARGAKIMVVDEVTSTLPPSDARRVTETLARSTERGATIIMVTHKLSEVLDVTKRIVMLIDGSIAVDQSTKGLDHASLTDLLLKHEGRKATDAVEEAEYAGAHEVRLSLDGVTSGVVGPVDLELRAGEITGVGGLPGSGLHDLAFLVHGITKPETGTRTLHRGSRTSLVPPHRETQGGFDDHSVESNIAVSSLSRWKIGPGLLSTGRQRRAATETVDTLNVVPNDANYRFGALSGGNKQKVILGRALLSESDVFVLCEPTRGVDVGTRHEIYALVRRLKADGAAILVLSSDSEDLFAVCDRVSVIYEGVLSEPRQVADISLENLEALL